MPDDKKLYKIGEIAQISGVLPSTVRYYVSQGLLVTSNTTQGGYMLFDKKDTLDRMKKIKKLKEENRLTINEIKATLISK